MWYVVVVVVVVTADGRSVVLVEYNKKKNATEIWGAWQFCAEAYELMLFGLILLSLI